MLIVDSLPVLNVDEIDSTTMASGTNKGVGDKTGSKIKATKSTSDKSVAY